MNQTDTNGTPPAKKEHPVILAIKNAESEIMKHLPDHIGRKRMFRIMISCIRKEEKLLKCDPLSLINALAQCASTGLEPGTPRSRACILPYGTEAKFQIESKGWIKLYLDAGAAMVWGGVVYKYEVEKGLFKHVKGQRPEHDPDYFNIHGDEKSRNDENIVGSYFVIEMGIPPKCPFFVEVSDLTAILRARNCSKAWKYAEVKTKIYGSGQKDSPWHTAFPDLCSKVPQIRIGKIFQIDKEDNEQIANALAVEYQNSDLTQIPAERAPASNGGGVKGLKAHTKGNGGKKPDPIDADSETVPPKLQCKVPIFQSDNFKEFEMAKGDPYPPGDPCPGPCGKPDKLDEGAKPEPIYTCSSPSEKCDRAAAYARLIEQGKAEPAQATLPTEETEYAKDECQHGKRKKVRTKQKTGKNKGKMITCWFCKKEAGDPEQCEPNFGDMKEEAKEGTKGPSDEDIPF